MEKLVILLLILIPQVTFASIEGDINFFRENNLIVDKQLIKTANFKVNDRLFHKYFNHINPFNDSIVDIFKRFNVKWSLCGEVLSIGYNEKEVVTSWLNSKTHKEVLLEDNYTRVGCYYKKGITVCHFN